MLRTSPLSLATCLLLIHAWCIDSAAQETDIKLGKETTFITEPLADDGLPNYALAILEQQRKGVTPQNNAAVVLWQQLGRIEGMTGKEFALLCAEIGLDNLPEGQLRFPSSEPDFAETIKEFHSHPWQNSDNPMLATWIEQNNDRIDALADACRRQHFYSPSISYLANPESELFIAQHNEVDAMRMVAKILSLRACSHLGSGEVEAGLQDVQALVRWSRHAASNRSVVHQLVAMAMKTIAYNLLQHTLNDRSVQPALANEIARFLDDHSWDSTLADAVNYGERFQQLDWTLRVLTVRLGGTSSAEGLTKREGEKFDKEWVLEVTNRRYDRIVDELLTKDIRLRFTRLRATEAEMRKLTQKAKEPTRIAAGFLSRKVRSEIMADNLTGVMLPALSAALDSEHRTVTQRNLLRIATALRSYQLEYGHFPENLTDLQPDYLKELPIDLYSGKPLIFQRRDRGYLLYSVGRNTADDLGSNTWYFSDNPKCILKGEWIDSSTLPDRDVNLSREEFNQMFQGDDLVIRMPLPKVEWQHYRKNSPG